MLVASSSKAKKRRKGGFSDVELIVDPTSDECSAENQHRGLYSLPNPTQVLPGMKYLDFTCFYPSSSPIWCV